jgi:ParB family chromosome partitioning protein
MNTAVTLIPIAEIAILNPRSRNQVTFEAIVASIKAVGLKKPITVSPRPKVEGDPFRYNLACGQGRIEAFLTLGEKLIPALIRQSTEEECWLKSLTENLARHPASPNALYVEIRRLRARGYKPESISKKLGMNISYVYELVNLLDRGETQLLKDVEARRVPITVAAMIASGNDADIQRALSEAYQTGELRGAKLEAVKRLVARRSYKKKDGHSVSKAPKLTAAVLVRSYERQTQRQRALVARAAVARRRLLIAAAAMKTLMADENFATLLRAENLLLMPTHLSARAKAGAANA